MPRKSRQPDTGHTILLVDDQEEVLLSGRGLLEREGHRVLTASSGEQALAALRENNVQLILLDYFLPRTSGEQLVREIRSIDPFVQIILHTAYSGEKPPRTMLESMDIQGYHDKADGPEKLLLWVRAGLKAFTSIQHLRDRERQHGELIANVSHELRTPLGIIGGYTDLLLDGAFGAMPESARVPLRALAGTSHTLSELVRNFLMYAKLEARSLSIDRQWVSTDELAREIRQLGAFLVEDTNVRFSIDVAKAPAGLFTDRTKLAAMLRNLVSNAAKFTAAGEIAVSIAKVPAGLVRFAVRDTGVGIAPNDEEAIFEPFQHLDGSLTTEPGGIGLGLALSRRLARLLGGDVEVRSERGAGSTFTLTLPDGEALRETSDESPTA